MNNTLIWLLWASPYSFDNIIPILISFEKSVKCRTKRRTEQNKKRRTHCHKLQRFILKSRYSKFIRTGLRRLVCKCHCEERVRDRRASSRRTLNEHQNAARYMKQPVKLCENPYAHRKANFDPHGDIINLFVYLIIKLKYTFLIFQCAVHLMFCLRMSFLYIFQRSCFILIRKCT